MLPIRTSERRNVLPPCTISFRAQAPQVGCESVPGFNCSRTVESLTERGEGIQLDRAGSTFELKRRVKTGCNVSGSVVGPAGAGSHETVEKPVRAASAPARNPRQDTPSPVQNRQTAPPAASGTECGRPQMQTRIRFCIPGQWGCNAPPDRESPRHVRYTSASTSAIAPTAGPSVRRNRFRASRCCSHRPRPDGHPLGLAARRNRSATRVVSAQFVFEAARRPARPNQSRPAPSRAVSRALALVRSMEPPVQRVNYRFYRQAVGQAAKESPDGQIFWQRTEDRNNEDERTAGEGWQRPADALRRACRRTGQA